MKRVLLDLNVVLDILLDRKPHVYASAQLWAAIETGRLHGLLPAHGVTTVHYLIRRELGNAAAQRTLNTITQALRVAAVNGEVIQRALALAWPDFEDAVTAAAAEHAKCDVIVTRDPKGFPDCPLPVLTPEAAAAWLSQV